MKIVYLLINVCENLLQMEQLSFSISKGHYHGRNTKEREGKKCPKWAKPSQVSLCGGRRRCYSVDLLLSLHLRRNEITPLAIYKSDNYKLMAPSIYREIPPLNLFRFLSQWLSLTHSLTLFHSLGFCYDGTSFNAFRCEFNHI